MTIHSTATTADLIAGTKIRQRSVPRTFWQRAWIPWTLVVVMLGAMAAVRGGMVAFLVSVVPFAVVLAAVRPLVSRLTARRVVRANPFLTETQSISFADDGVECVAPSLNTKRPWAALTSWIDRPAMLVLNLSDAVDGAYVVVCKGDTDDATWAAVRGRLTAHLGPAMS